MIFPPQKPNDFWTSLEMWPILIVVALPQNFEPTRVALILAFLTRPCLTLNLSCVLAGKLFSSLSLGALVSVGLKYRSHQTHIQADGNTQLLLGILLILTALFIGLKHCIRLPRLYTRPLGRVKRFIVSLKENNFSNMASHTLVRYSSPYSSASLALVLGTLLGLPSLDYLSILAIIASSRLSLASEFIAILVFQLLTCLVLITIILSVSIFKLQTKHKLKMCLSFFGRMNASHHAAMLFILGTVQVCLGIANR